MKHKRLLLAVAITLAVLGALSVYALQKPQETVNDNTSTTTIGIANPNDLTDRTLLTADTVIGLTNDYRTSKGLPTLASNESLHSSACAKAQHMIDNNYWSHYAPDGTDPWYFIANSGYEIANAGENLAKGQRSSKAVVDGWINSPKHNEILTAQYNDIGVCALTHVKFNGSVEYTTLTVAHFGTSK